MKKIIFVIFFGLTSLFASDVDGVTDFIPRLVNFVIFAAILYYLLADKVKNFFSERSEGIAKEFQTIQDKIVESKKRKDNLKAEVEKAHLQAEEIIKTAKSEVVTIQDKIASSTKNELLNLDRQLKEFKESEERKMKVEVVSEYMELVTENININSNEAANIIIKKVVA